MTDLIILSALVAPPAYVVGSFSPAVLLGRVLKGVDIRQRGSRNAGALNTAHEVGVWAGFLVLALDTLKGLLVMLAVRQLDLGEVGMFVAALAVVVGHNWPFYLGFRGGKGVATIFGISFAVLPLLTLVSAVVAVAFWLVSRNVILGISVAFIVLNALTIATGQSAAIVTTCLVLSFIVVFTHFGLAYRDVLASVRARGVWGLFEGG